MAEKTGAVQAPALKKGKGEKSTKSEAKSSSHPSSAAMIKEAISKLNEKGGSSLYAIKKYIADEHKLDMEKHGNFIRKALKNAVEAASPSKAKNTAAKKTEAEPKAKEVKTAKPTAPKTSAKAKPVVKKSQVKVKLPKTLKPTAAAAKPKTGSQKKAAPKKK
ncbi:Histone H1.2 [Orchesella cincta]|uniref:Histone H1.2 n=1 Tax=Orchesella cincta TaxID=48709 RepID=A0A1D2N1S5_ORCCI|nr:Histone H1.2 [Orchesella cincta]